MDVARKYIKSFMNESRRIQEDLDASAKAKIDAAVAKWLESHKDGITYYVDYNDSLSKQQIAEIFESERPLEAFYDLISDFNWYENDTDELAHIRDNELGLDKEFIQVHSQEIMDALIDAVPFNIPFKSFDEFVNFDVFLNNPDAANTEYSEDYVTRDENDKVVEVSSEIAKFLELQGHSAEEYINYVNDENAERNEFFEALSEEIDNANSGCQIVFLVKASIMEMAKAIQDKGVITIPEDATCGLVGTGNGSGSLLEMKLEKSITGSIVDKSKPSYQSREGLLDPFYYEGYRYNVNEIYGLVNSAWDARVEFSQAQNAEEQV